MSEKKSDGTLLILILVVASIFCLNIQQSFAFDPKLRVDGPATVEAIVNNSFEIVILAENVIGLFGWELILRWNSSLVNCTAETINYALWTAFLGPWVSAPIDNVNNQYHQSLTARSPAAPIDGTFWLVNLTFKIVEAPADGGTVAIALTLEPAPGYTYCLIDEFGQEIPHEYVHGYVTLEGPPIHDIAVVGVTPASNLFLRGFCLNVNVTVENLGDYVETFNVTAFANTTIIGELQVSLIPSESDTLGFLWNTTDVSLGNYTIKASASPVAEEIDIENNLFVYGMVSVTRHDIYIVDMTLSKSVIGQGYPQVFVNVTVENQGNYLETFNVTMWANETIIETISDIILTSQNSIILTSTWNTTDIPIGIYLISASASLVPHEENTADNSYVDGTVTVLMLHYDVATIDVTTSKDDCPPLPTLGEGFTANITVMVENQGDFTETFNVTAYANATAIGTQSVTLDLGENQTLTFMWNATDFLKGNYTIKASADTVLGETDVIDNTLVDGMILVTVPGDINGDQYVNAKDAIALGVAFSPFGEYNPNADINDDGYCNAKDAVILGVYFGEHWE